MNIFTYFPPLLLMYMKHATMHWQRREEKSDRTKPFSHRVLRGGGGGVEIPNFCTHFVDMYTLVLSLAGSLALRLYQIYLVAVLR